MNRTQDLNWKRKLAEVERKIKDLHILRSQILVWIKQTRYNARTAGPKDREVLIQECKRAEILSTKYNILLTQAKLDHALLCEHNTKKNLHIPINQTATSSYARALPPPEETNQAETMDNTIVAYDPTGSYWFCFYARYFKHIHH